MGKISLRNVVIGTAVGVGCGVVLAKKYYDRLDEECKIKENSKKLAEQASEWGKSVGEATKRVYLTVFDKMSDISEEVKEKINKKKAQYDTEEEAAEKCDETLMSEDDYNEDDCSEDDLELVDEYENYEDDEDIMDEDEEEYEVNKFNEDEE